MDDVWKALQQFDIDGEPIWIESFGEGHINETYSGYFKHAEKAPFRVILQKINTLVFRDPYALMENITAVTKFIGDKMKKSGDSGRNEVLTVIPTRLGQSMYADETGGFWRSYVFIENAKSYQTVERPILFFSAAKAFGKFQRMLDDFPAQKLHETIPDFHNTPKRFADFVASVQKDAATRAKGVEREIDFVVSRERECGIITGLLNNNEIPVRVTHNDTKLNNVMIDADTDEGVCVIDLDTVMPGSVLYDFGDSIRFGTNPAPEDEKDLDKVVFSLPLYEEYIKGFISEARLTEMELENLAWGARLMTYECGMRFLADYLDGDIYFRTSRPEQNLDRARTQFKLVADMERHYEHLQKIAVELAGR